jgi:hypothetical protein
MVDLDLPSRSRSRAFRRKGPGNVMMFGNWIIKLVQVLLVRHRDPPEFSTFVLEKHFFTKINSLFLSGHSDLHQSFN